MDLCLPLASGKFHLAPGQAGQVGYVNNCFCHSQKKVGLQAMLSLLIIVMIMKFSLHCTTCIMLHLYIIVHISAIYEH